MSWDSREGWLVLAFIQLEDGDKVKFLSCRPGVPQLELPVSAEGRNTRFPYWFAQMYSIYTFSPYSVSYSNIPYSLLFKIIFIVYSQSLYHYNQHSRKSGYLFVGFNDVLVFFILTFPSAKNRSWHMVSIQWISVAWIKELTGNRKRHRFR